ncbi:hypothetical protein M404DRAFT_1004988, partial [Pisolithus tinctorius Marx 270]
VDSKPYRLRSYYCAEPAIIQTFMASDRASLSSHILPDLMAAATLRGIANARNPRSLRTGVLGMPYPPSSESKPHAVSA